MGKLAAGAVQSSLNQRWGLTFSGIGPADDLYMRSAGKEYSLSGLELAGEISEFCVRVPGRFDEFILNLKKLPTDFFAIEFVVMSQSPTPMGWTLQSQVSMESWSSDRIAVSAGVKTLLLRLSRSEEEWEIESLDQELEAAQPMETLSPEAEVHIEVPQVASQDHLISQVWCVLDSSVSMDRILRSGATKPVVEALHSIAIEQTRRPLQVIFGDRTFTTNAEFLTRLSESEIAELLEEAGIGQGVRQHFRDFAEDPRKNKSALYVICESFPPISDELIGNLEKANLRVRIVILGENVIVPDLPLNSVVRVTELGEVAESSQVDQLARLLA